VRELRSDHHGLAMDRGPEMAGEWVDAGYRLAPEIGYEQAVLQLPRKPPRTVAPFVMSHAGAQTSTTTQDRPRCGRKA